MPSTKQHQYHTFAISLMIFLLLRHIPKEMIWGGKKLKDIYGYDIPSNHTGECWAISAHQNGDCTMADGEFVGKKLSQLWDEHRELFGNIEGEQFPLLIKIIDACNDLSVQVINSKNSLISFSLNTIMPFFSSI